MKKIIFLLFAIIPFTAISQSHMFDTIVFYTGGKIYQVVSWNDSVKINDQVYYRGWYRKRTPDLSAWAQSLIHPGDQLMIPSLRGLHTGLGALKVATVVYNPTDKCLYWQDEPNGGTENLSLPFIIVDTIFSYDTASLEKKAPVFSHGLISDQSVEFRGDILISKSVIDSLTDITYMVGIGEDGKLKKFDRRNLSILETDPTISAWAKAEGKPNYSYTEVGAASENHNHDGTYLKSFIETDPTISAWAKAASKPSYSYTEVGAAPASTVSFPGFGTTGSTAAYGDHNHSGVYQPAGSYLTSYTETDPTVSAWAKAATKPSYTYTEVGAAPSSTVSFPGFGTTNSTAAYGDHNHSGVYQPAGSYLTSYTETDPTVSAWAKAATKPSYTYTEVGAAPSSTVSFPGFGTTGSTAAYGDHNHSGVYQPAGSYLTSYTETDPTVSAWAKAASKPSYTYTEVGAAPSSTVSFPGFGTSHSTAAYGDHNHSGVYQPAGSYLTSYTETDPVFSASASAGITSGNISTWNGLVTFPGFGTSHSTAAYGDHTHANYLTSYTETDPTIYSWAKQSAKPSYTYSEVGAAPSSTVSFPGFGTTGSTACVGNDSRLSDARPASDVLAWAKAGSKPSYTYSEVGAAPSSTVSFPGFGTSHSTAAYGDHNHSGVYQPAGSYLTSYTESDPLVSAWAKAASKPTYTYSEVGAAPSSTVSFPGFGTTGSTACVGNDARLSDARPASDVYSWAKASSKPSYTYSEVGAAPSSTVSFPGFGTSHSTAAYGDHNHSGVYQPAGSYLTSYTETDPTIYSWAKQSAKPSYTYSEVGAAPSSTVSFPGFGTTGSTACVGNDSRLSDARPASDVYSWAKASSKPSYSYSEVGAPSTSGTNASGTWGINISGTAAAASSVAWGNITGKPLQGDWSTVGSISNVVGMLSWKNYGNGHVIFDASAGTTPSGTACNNSTPNVTWSATYPTLMGWNGTSTYGVRVDYSRYSESSANSTYGRYVYDNAAYGGSAQWKEASALRVAYAATAGSAPASDVYSWAKQSSKPTYTYSEVGAAASGHNHDGVYSPVSHTHSGYASLDSCLFSQKTGTTYTWLKDMNKRVGIGTATPIGKLSVLQTDASGGAGVVYGAMINATGAAGWNIALAVSAMNAVNNYAIVQDAGHNFFNTWNGQSFFGTGTPQGNIHTKVYIDGSAYLKDTLWWGTRGAYIYSDNQEIPVIGLSGHFWVSQTFQAKTIATAGLGSSGYQLWLNNDKSTPNDSSVLVSDKGNLAIGSGTAQTERLYVNGDIKITGKAKGFPVGYSSGADSTYMNTTVVVPIGYSTGFVIDTLVFIATTTASGGSVNITPKIFFGTDQSGSGTAVITSPSAITTKSSAVKVSSFNNATVASGNMLWLKFTDVTTKPKNILVQIIGHSL